MGRLSLLGAGRKPNNNTPAPIGTFLLNELSTSDYVATGCVISNPTPTTLRLVQPSHTLGISSAYYAPYLTGRDRFTIRVKFKINTKDSESWGFGPSICTYGGGGDDYLSGIVGNAFNDTTIYLWQGAGNLIASHLGTLPPTNANDIIEGYLTVDINTYTFTVINRSQGNATDTITFSETYTIGVLKTTRALAYYGFRMFGGDYTVLEREISTPEYRFGDILLIADSKGVGGFCDAVINKAIEIIKANNPTKHIVNNSGFNDTSERIALKKAELLDYQSSEVWLMFLSNDIRFGVANYQTKTDAIIADHQANGSVVKALNCLAEGAGGVDVTPANTYWASTGLQVVDLYTPSLAGGLLCSDNIHPNALSNTTVIAPGMQTIV